MFCSITTESVNTNFTNPCRKPCNLIISRSNIHICTIVTVYRKPVCISDGRIVIRCFVFSCINAVPFCIVNWSNSYARSKFSFYIRKTAARAAVFRTSSITERIQGPNQELFHKSLSHFTVSFANHSIFPV